MEKEWEKFSLKRSTDVFSYENSKNILPLPKKTPANQKYNKTNQPNQNKTKSHHTKPTK